LVQTVGADSISAPNRADMESAPTQYVAERMVKADLYLGTYLLLTLYALRHTYNS